MVNQREWLAATLLIGALALTGCAGAGSDANDPPVASEAPNEPGASDEEPEQPNEPEPGVELPDHMPIAVAEGGTVHGVFEPAEGTMQDHWLARVLYPENAFDELVSHFDAELAGAGVAQDKVEGANSVRWTGTGGSGIVTMKLETGNAHYPGYAVFELGWNP